MCLKREMGRQVCVWGLKHFKSHCGAHIIQKCGSLVSDFWVIKRLGLVLYFGDLQSEIRGVRPLA